MGDKRFKIYQDSIRKFESNRIWGVKSETNSLEPYMTFKEAKKCCDLLNEQQAIIEEQEKVIKKQRKEYINLKENMDALRRTWAERYKHKKRRVWNY